MSYVPLPAVPRCSAIPRRCFMYPFQLCLDVRLSLYMFYVPLPAVPRCSAIPLRCPMHPIQLSLDVRPSPLMFYVPLPGVPRCSATPVDVPCTRSICPTKFGYPRICPMYPFQLSLDVRPSLFMCYVQLPPVPRCSAILVDVLCTPSSCPSMFGHPRRCSMYPFLLSVDVRPPP